MNGAFNPLLFVALFFGGISTVIAGAYDLIENRRIAICLVTSVLGSVAFVVGLLGLSSNWR